MFFFFTNLSQGNLLYCLRFLIQTKNVNTACTPIEIKQNLLHQIFFVKILVSFAKLLNTSLDEQHLFLRVPYSICETLLKVNYVPADGKSFILRAFIKAEMILFCLYAESHIIFSIDFLHSSLIQLFFKKTFQYKMKI